MYRGKLQKSISDAVSKLYQIDIEPEITVPELEFGDFASNIAFQVAKIAQKAPREVAEDIKQEIRDEMFTSVEVAGSGYLNFTLNEAIWIKELEFIDESYGRKQSNIREKVQVEFISANPTGPLTLGNARGGFLGDVLAGVLQSQGYEVVREYYFNDAGTQISELIKSVRAAGGMEVDGETQYRGDYIDRLAEQYADKLAMDDADLAQLLTATIFKEHIEPALKNMNVTFDVYFNERDLSDGFEDVVNMLKSSNLTEEKDDALWLKSTNYGDERDRVLIKASGDTTYLGNDIAYHQNIFIERAFDSSIKIWGADHVGQVPSLKLTINELFPEKTLEFVIVQWVRLIRDGKEVKISKRAGTFVTVNELIEEVGADVARFFFLQRSNDSQMDFDLDLAKEQSQKNPFYYVMYSYARASSIIEAAKLENTAPSEGTTKLSEQEKNTIRKMVQLPQLLEEIALSHEVHKLSYFALELSKLFTQFYENVRVIDLPKEQAAEKLYFVHKYQQCMRSLFAVMGITPQEKM